MPDWLELKGPKRIGERGLTWGFEVRTDKPGQYLTSVVFECDTGAGICQISLEIKEGQPALGNLVLCDSPFDRHTTHESLSSLVRILSALPIRFHCVQSLTELGQLQPRTILLHQSGLLRCKSDGVELLERLAAAGVNILVFADEFFHGTTAAANQVLGPFGLRMKQSGADDPGLAQEERAKRILDWQARYEHTPFNAGPEHISAHPLTQGVNRLHWFRPCPVVCEMETARPLVRNPAEPSECFAAVATPGGYVVVAGMSLWSGLSSVGWPYDNDRFLANILVGGDAQAVAV